MQNTTLVVALLVVATVVIAICAVSIKKYKDRQRIRVEGNPVYRDLVATMKVLVTSITNSPERYLTRAEREGVKLKIDKVLQQAQQFQIKKKYCGYAEYYELIIASTDILPKLDELNECFVQSALEQHKLLFDNIDGKSLDMQQRRAVVIDEKYNLVIAGAGSGKTLTILGKVAYLLQQGVKANEILLIAFTRKSAGELEERISRNLHMDIKTGTFHKLGLDIITKNNKQRPDIDDNIDKYVQDYFSQKILEDNDAIVEFIEFIGYYFNIPIELKADGTLGEKIENENYADLETLKNKYNKVMAKEKKTIKGEMVKSMEELIIANFLFLNGIDYEYEREYPYQTDKMRKRYRPDFWLTGYDIYLEHFGIDKYGKCPWLSAIEAQKYTDGITWKRQLHTDNHTKLIETYSYFQSEGKLLINLREILLSSGTLLKPISNNEVKPLLMELQTENVSREFFRLCITFITLFKSNGYDAGYFERLRKQIKTDYFVTSNPFTIDRSLRFISIIQKVYQYYQLRLKQNKAIDFADMIGNATGIVTNGGIIDSYKHIIIDEYQDIGMDRYRLIKAIIDKTGAHLMCVGDDWQSIYRFAGSDSDLFVNFAKYWGSTSVSKIENTYRNSQELINIASKFIMQNPVQISKTLRSNKLLQNPICIHYYGNNLITVLTGIIDSIVEEQGEQTSILLLGRINNDIKLLRFNKNSDYGRANEDIEPFSIRAGSIVYKKYPELRLAFLTVHKSKGLEADNVIIINMKNARLGFPNKIADDPLLQLLIPYEDKYPYSEERRLFYVALTRTRGKTFLLVPDRNASVFIDEIKPFCHIETLDGKNIVANNPLCPKCKTGKLRLRQISEFGKPFVSCSNFPSCDFTNNDTSIIERPTKCPSCGGFLVVRKSSNGGMFLGCTNYPTCKHTKAIGTDKTIHR
jgi:DNA helicase-4